MNIKKLAFVIPLIISGCSQTSGESSDLNECVTIRSGVVLSYGKPQRYETTENPDGSTTEVWEYIKYGEYKFHYTSDRQGCSWEFLEYSSSMELGL